MRDFAKLDAILDAAALAKVEAERFNTGEFAYILAAAKTDEARDAARAELERMIRAK